MEKQVIDQKKSLLSVGIILLQLFVLVIMPYLVSTQAEKIIYTVLILGLGLLGLLLLYGKVLKKDWSSFKAHI